MDETEITTQVVGRVKLIAPQITSVSDSAMQMFAGDAYDKAVSDGFTDTAAVRAAGYLAAHYANLADAKNSNVKSESAAVLSREYFDRGSDDSYLDEYNRLLAGLLGSQTGPNMAVFM